MTEVLNRGPLGDMDPGDGRQGENEIARVAREAGLTGQDRGQAGEVTRVAPGMDLRGDKRTGFRPGFVPGTAPTQGRMGAEAAVPRADGVSMSRQRLEEVAQPAEESAPNALASDAVAGPPWEAAARPHTEDATHHRPLFPEQGSQAHAQSPAETSPPAVEPAAEGAKAANEAASEAQPPAEAGPPWGPAKLPAADTSASGRHESGTATFVDTGYRGAHEATPGAGRREQPTTIVNKYVGTGYAGDHEKRGPGLWNRMKGFAKRLRGSGKTSGPSAPDQGA